MRNSNRPPQRNYADDWGDDRYDYRAGERDDEQDDADRYRRDRQSRQSGRWGADEPSYGRSYGDRPAPSVGGRPNRGGPQYEQGGQYPGTRPAGRNEALRSRSADPGQSSYGGFYGEDPRWQRQQLDYSEPSSYDDHGAPRYAGSGPQGWQDPALARSQRITPKGYVRSDERVREDLCERLSRSGLDVSDVSVDVSDSTVTLEGTVPNRRTKHAIEDCADDCLGVSDIQNRIRVAVTPENHPGMTRME
ncbi:BON domain-containing protein [Bordetella petrii]|uniref:BON domain-containing protein n=1 Tax=Bordetella petrii TaxID=94624 RepID=UPI001E2AB405|nr:BON domain-containing protein [Bordetella petrii]MCD0504438.1 BON domain-containing protein [Bordetella petrii]